MDIQPFIKSKSELTHSISQSGPIVLSTRIRLARNLKKYPFPGRANNNQLKDIASLCEDACNSISSLQKEKCITLRMDALKELERQILVERHLISRELASSQNGTSAVISKNQSIAIMINEEDHLRIQVLKSGFQFKKAWKIVDNLDSELEEKLDYAFSSELGYLTACPTNLGTAMRASVMMHLPGLVIAEQMDKVVRAVNQLGLAVRGLFGEGSEANGSIFQISNQQTLGESEETIMQRLTGVLNTIIEQENNIRLKLLETEKNKIFDKIGRAFGLLRYAYSINSVEAMNLLSLMRLAIDLNMISEDYRTVVDRLLIENQPGHIQASNQENITADQRDFLRAELLRNAFNQLPGIDFNLSNKKA